MSALLEGLGRPEKSLPSKFFYDETGSKLFDQICHLEAYYPTRTELAIFREFAGEMAGRVGRHSHLVEFGSGSSTKIRILMEAFDTPLGYIPIDISKEHLVRSANAFIDQVPDVPVTAICADYTSTLHLPEIDEGQYVGFYPGSTIGNFTPNDATAFLKRVGRELTGGGMLIGVDLIKDPAILNTAYNDPEGVTAAFNKNILARSNRELGTSFDLDSFEHWAFYNDDLNRIEMHLRSTRDQLVRVRDQSVTFRKGETIHTENSYKYTLDSFRALARAAGFTPLNAWVDEDRLFSVHYLMAP